MHLRSTAAQQVDEGGVEGHDGVTQVDAVLLMLLLATKPEGQNSIHRMQRSGQRICNFNLH